MKFLIIDGYVDEPTCLGVPPYLSTYVRYAAGAAVCSGLEQDSIDYLTIEKIREMDYRLGENYGFSVIITGNPVPGKYLGGKPVTMEEMNRIGIENSRTLFYAGGPLNIHGLSFLAPNIRSIRQDIEAAVYEKLYSGKLIERKLSRSELEAFSLAGAFIVRRHPRFPDIIMEIETGRGCPRLTHCSFCIEGRTEIMFREPLSVAAEMETIYREGIRHFRLGKQADLFSFGTSMEVWNNGFPAPSPEKIKILYSSIRDRLPEIKTLHLDNVNPGLIANFPEESYKIARIIASANTPGDVAALGMESADPAVILKNCLKAGPEEVRLAVKIINEAGGEREDGVPKLLPGINLIRGLPGESRETFPMNYEFLKSVYESGLLLRRINIRQLKIQPGLYETDPARISAREEKKLDAIFRNYRERIRMEIDNPMLKKIYPVGTLLKGLIVETVRGDWSIARQLGSYPVAVNIPKIMGIHSKLDGFITGYRERSLVGLASPLDPGKATLAEIKQIPGYSKRAGEIFSRHGWGKGDLADSPFYDSFKQHIL